MAVLLDGSHVHGIRLFLDLVERILRAELLLEEVVDATLLLNPRHMLLNSLEAVRVVEAFRYM